VIVLGKSCQSWRGRRRRLRARKEEVEEEEEWAFPHIVASELKKSEKRSEVGALQHHRMLDTGCAHEHDWAFIGRVHSALDSRERHKIDRRLSPFHLKTQTLSINKDEA
jgi:hypothetical protein